MDVKVGFLPVSRAELLSDRGFTEPTSVVAKRVEAARDRAAARLRHSPWRLNAEIPGRDLRAASRRGRGRSHRWNGPWTWVRSAPAGWTE